MLVFISFGDQSGDARILLVPELVQVDFDESSKMPEVAKFDSFRFVHR